MRSPDLTVRTYLWGSGGLIIQSVSSWGAGAESSRDGVRAPSFSGSLTLETQQQGPPIKLFCSTSFHYNTDEKKQIRFCLVHGSCRVSTCSARLCGFSPILQIPSTSQWYAGEVNGRVSLSSECGFGCEWPWDGRTSHPGGSRLVPWAARTGSGHSRPSIGINRLDNYLTCFYQSFNISLAHISFTV